MPTALAPIETTNPPPHGGTPLFERRLHLAHQRFGIGKLSGGFLGIDAPPVQADFEHAPRRGDELERADLELKTQQLSRQTDGFGFVVSSRAVLDDDFRFHATGWRS